MLNCMWKKNGEQAAKMFEGFAALRDSIINWHVKLKESNSRVMQSRSKNKANIMYFVLDSGLSITVEESGLGITDQ